MGECSNINWMDHAFNQRDGDVSQRARGEG
jgi:hypothetical protein